MTIITIDIESDYSHDPAVIERVCQKVTPPANYKSEEAIEKWWKEKGNDQKVEAQRKTALEPLYGSIKMIGYQFNDGEPEVLTGAEKDILERFFSMMNTLHKPDADGVPYVPMIVGHNVKCFDLDFIRKRAIVNGVKMPRWMNVYFKRYAEDVYDTMEEWAGWGKRVKLDDLAFALLGETKTSDGAASLDMTDSECAEYCKEDCRLTYEIYLRMTGQK
jgi:3'-5' exonuclease